MVRTICKVNKIFMILPAVSLFAKSLLSRTAPRAPSSFFARDIFVDDEIVCADLRSCQTSRRDVDRIVRIWMCHGQDRKMG